MRSRASPISIRRGCSSSRRVSCSERTGPPHSRVQFCAAGWRFHAIPPIIPHMAARPTWKGFLKISLVNIPVRVFPATDSAATISFNQLHGECQTRIQQKRWCPKCEREVPLSEVVKGYEFEKGRYVVMDEEDLAKVRPESTRVIDLVQFTEVSAIDPIYI